MITVTQKTNQIRGSHSLSETSIYFVSSISDWKLVGQPKLWRPPTDVYELDDRFVVRVEIPGVNESDFSISMDQTTLAISGSRTDNADRRSFHQMEIHFGDFMTEVVFASPIDIEHVTAEYSNGFLLVTLPKAQPQQIKINKE